MVAREDALKIKKYLIRLNSYTFSVNLFTFYSDYHSIVTIDVFNKIVFLINCIATLWTMISYMSIDIINS